MQAMNYETNILRGLIKQQGYTEGEIADRLGVSKTTFSKKINRKVTFELTEAMKLCEILNVGLDEVFLKDRQRQGEAV